MILLDPSCCSCHLTPYQVCDACQAPLMKAEDCQDAIHIARMYGYPGPSHDDIYPPSDCEPSPPVVETKASEVLPEAETERMWAALKEIAGG